MKIDKVVILLIMLGVIGIIVNVVFANAVLSSDIPWWLKYFLIFR